MASDPELASAALHLLGEKSITALTDDTERARVANALYAMTRDATLRAHPWRFALKRKELAADVTGPIFEFTTSYTIPSDALRVLKTDWTPPPIWRVEARKVVTDQGAPIKILYIAQITDPQQFDALFIEAFIMRLASKMAVAVSGNYKRGADLFLMYKDALSEARSLSGQEGVPEAFDTNWLTEIR